MFRVAWRRPTSVPAPRPACRPALGGRRREADDPWLADLRRARRRRWAPCVTSTSRSWRRVAGGSGGICLGRAGEKTARRRRSERRRRVAGACRRSRATAGAAGVVDDRAAVSVDYGEAPWCPAPRCGALPDGDAGVSGAPIATLVDSAAAAIRRRRVRRADELDDEARCAWRGGRRYGARLERARSRRLRGAPDRGDRGRHWRARRARRATWPPVAGA